MGYQSHLEPGLSLHLLPVFVYTSSEGSQVRLHICTGSFKHSLIAYVINNKVTSVGSVCQSTFYVFSVLRRIRIKIKVFDEKQGFQCIWSLKKASQRHLNALRFSVFSKS